MQTPSLGSTPKVVLRQTADQRIRLHDRSSCRLAGEVLARYYGPMSDTAYGGAGRRAWHAQLTQALDAHEDEPTARFVQLATIDTERSGAPEPANRTVVFRGFSEPGPGLIFVTDCRSTKVQQIRTRPVGSVCWYFPNTREQFRLTGRLRCFGADASEQSHSEQRRALWDHLSESTKAQFGWGRPGAPAEPDIGAGVPSTPPDTFCLLVLSPSHVDYLSVDVTPHRRTIYRQDSAGGWETHHVNP